MEQAHIIISGFVQGVGFRHFVKKNAIKLGLTGWVRNTQDGKVEAIFQGEKENIEEIIKVCKKGPFISEVKNMEVKWEEGKEKFAGFEIVI
ncbi:acylphosphatase [Candidatus Microgenomates bacterium]|nr:MAG: acylphosphatase [Candidatus Microgenomates bacterium]